jgi:hypothetical protein
LLEAIAYLIARRYFARHPTPLGLATTGGAA